MFKFLSKTCLFTALCVGILAAQIASVVPFSAYSGNAKNAAHHLSFQNKTGGDFCSSTAVGPHTLLTAAHCILGTGKVFVDDKDHVAAIKSIMYDEEDHVLLVTDMTFADYIKIEERAPVKGEKVSFWGWPGRSTDALYREGLCIDQEGELYIFKIPSFPGDSGSGVIDAAGNIITVVSLGDQSADMAGAALAFTSEQLSAIN